MVEANGFENVCLQFVANNMSIKHLMHLSWTEIFFLLYIIYQVAMITCPTFSPEGYFLYLTAYKCTICDTTTFRYLGDKTQVIASKTKQRKTIYATLYMLQLLIYIGLRNYSSSACSQMMVTDYEILSHYLFFCIACCKLLGSVL